jgi:N-acetylglucosaminyldiphosphoundecaprenol N-acetyl-beta-D-mannosaminyltransferase
MSYNHNHYQTVKLFDYSIFNSSLEEIDTNSKALINTINQNAYVVAEKDRDFRKALLASDILLPDGISMVAAAKLFFGKKTKKIAGDDLHNHLIKKLDQQGKKCFYLGSSPKTLDKIKQKLSQEFPNVKAGFYSPPFKSEFSPVENKEMIDAINAFQPDVLFIGMTAPKQEKWAHAHKDQVNARLICSVGAVFDFYAGTVQRPGKIWIELGLEWLVRLVKEPKRMWRRYLYNGPVFILLVSKDNCKEKFRLVSNSLRELKLNLANK